MLSNIITKLMRKTHSKQLLKGGLYLTYVKERGHHKLNCCRFSTDKDKPIGPSQKELDVVYNKLVEMGYMVRFGEAFQKATGVGVWSCVPIFYQLPGELHQPTLVKPPVRYG